MKNIVRMVEEFRIKRFCETVYGYKPHCAIIGEWVRWWLYDSRLGEKRKRRVISPAIGITYRRKRAFADILFAQQARRNSEFFKILGVAEIENNPLKFLEKLRSLSLYEQKHKERVDRKFPDLKFCLLCCRTPKLVDSETEEEYVIRKLIEESRGYSRDSKMQWILYLLKYTKSDADYSFRVRDYVKGYQRFWYSYSFFGSEIYAHQGGELRAYREFEY